jgi:MFS family permease
LNAVVNLAHTLIAIPAGKLSDRVGTEKVLLGGYVIFLGTSLLILFGLAGFVAAFAIAGAFGLYNGTVETVQRAMVPKYAKTGLLGTAYGVYYLVVGAAFFVSNSIVGWLWNAYGSTPAMGYSAIASVAAIIVMVLFLRREKSITPQ